MKYDTRVIEEVQNAIDIVDVISQFVPLKRAGRNFKGLCPFHGEKTPSFMVNPEKQIFHCFGCSVGGDVFSFLMKYENMSFPEAIRNLAEKTGVRLPEISSHDGEGSSESEKLYKVYALATSFYQKQFADDEIGESAQKYLKSRGYSKEFAESFTVGWAADQWQSLYEYLQKKGCPEKTMLASGLIQKSSNGRFYDAFRGRVLFPIRNLQSKVVGFGGRLIGDGKGPKYLNSPENSIFHKRKELFGLHVAKKDIDREKPQLIVVEGYMDFFRLYEEGFKNTVATLGTALTNEHVKLMKRFVDEAIVIYDGDKAGQAASLRGLEVFLEEGMSVKLVRMPDGLDPDDFLVQKGSAQFREILEGAQDFFDYKMKLLKEKYDPNDSLGVVRLTNDILETLVKIKQPVLLNFYLRKLAVELHLDETSLRKELAKLNQKVVGRTWSKNAEQSQKPKEDAVKVTDEEILLISLMLDQPEFCEEARSEIQLEDFLHSGLQSLFSRLLEYHDEALPENRQSLMNTVNVESLKSRFASVQAMDWTPELRKQAFEDCVKKIKSNRKKLQLVLLRRQIADAEKAGDNAKVGQFMKEYQEILHSS